MKIKSGEKRKRFGRGNLAFFEFLGAVSWQIGRSVENSLR